jgi:hypothetical protein
MSHKEDGINLHLCINPSPFTEEASGRDAAQPHVTMTVTLQWQTSTGETELVVREGMRSKSCLALLFHLYMLDLSTR